MRLALAFAALAVIAAPAAAETPQQAYRRGFQDGVAAVNAQLGQVTARIQQQVQDQVNAQLAQIEARRGRDLDARLAAAQAEALADPPAQVAPTGAPATLPVSRMPTLPPMAQPPRTLPPRAPANLSANPADLPPGTTITITDPQSLPPDLFRALMDYAR